MRAKVYKENGRWWWECSDTTGALTMYGSRDSWRDAMEDALTELKNNHQWKTYTELSQHPDNMLLQSFYDAENQTRNSRDFWRLVGRIGK